MVSGLDCRYLKTELFDYIIIPLQLEKLFKNEDNTADLLIQNRSHIGIHNNLDIIDGV